MDIVDKEYIENKFINNLTSRKLFTGTYDINKIDEIYDDGIYIIVNTRNEGSVVCPFLLQVLNNISSNNINLCRQTLYDSIDGVFKVRYKDTTNNAAWTDWNAVIIDGTYIKNDTITRNKIDKSDTGLFTMYTTGDYNKLINTGVYTIWGVQGDNTIVSSLLFVSNILSSTYGTIIIQKRFGTQDNKLYERRYIDSTWSDWVTLPVYIANGQIKIENLRTPLKFPYSHQNSSIFNTVGEFDTIFNIVDSYNGMYVPVLGMQSLINTESNTYFRQSVYDANLGTFKYRSKNLDTNTFDDWTPIQIPYTTVKQSSVGLEATINKAITTGCYILSNTGVINYTNYAELLVVHRYENTVYQTHYSANNSIKARIGTVKSDNTVTWNSWTIKQHTYVLFINDTKAFTQSYKDNVLTEAAASKITEIITNLKYPTGYGLKLYYRINSDINAIKLNVNAFADKIIGNYFDWDTGTTKYYKISVENNAVKIETKTV